MTTPKFISTKNDLIEVANHILWHRDPAKTHCTFNEGMEREYENEASMIAEYFIKHSMILSTAMTRTFEEQFGAGNYDTELLRKAYREINDYML